MAGYLAAAGAGIALLDMLTSKGQSLTITDNIATTMVVNACITSETHCFSSVESSQGFTIQSNPAYAGFVSENLPKACAYCQQQLNSIYQARIALEQQAQLANPSYTAQAPNSDIQTQMTTGGPPNTSGGPTPVATPIPQLGACTLMCSNTVAINSAQSIQVTGTTTCDVENNISNDIQQSISGQISSYLKNQQDIIGQIESAFTSNSEALGVNIASDMNQNINTDFVQDLNQNLSANQAVTITGDSVYVANITQAFTGSMVGTLQVSNTVTDQLRQSATYSITQTLVNKNDTIGDLSGDFLQVIQAMSDLLETLTTDILIIIGAVLAAVVLVVGALYIFNQSFHTWADHAIKGKVEKYVGSEKPAEKQPQPQDQGFDEYQ